MAYEKLFSPYQLGTQVLKNRIVVLPYGTSMVHDGAVTDEDIAHFDTIAASGAGLIITGATVVHPGSAMRLRKLVEVYDERVLDGLRRRADVIHRHGAKLYGQLVHLGREWIGMESDLAPSAPSPIRSPRDPFPPRELEEGDIAAIVEAFGRSAANLKRCGYDGAEIHGAHGYLVAQFLSPACNQRGDAYGGSPEKRLRFLFEVIDAIRAHCGAGFGLSLRLSADEELVDGLEVDDTVAIAVAVAAYGGVDVLNITMGTRGGYVKDMTGPDAPAASAAARIRRACGLSVIVGQRINTPELAERLLHEGAADLVGMARAFLADPEWIDKAAAGESGRIRPCLNVNQDCRAFSPHLHCSVNPRTGRELWPEFRDWLPAAPVKRIAVIGAGPGGLEAALTAARRGHRVTLFEATDGVGGQFLYAAAVPHRQGLLRLIDHQVGELRRLGVPIRLGRRIDGVEDLGQPFDAAIVATGAVARALEVDAGGAAVLSWFDVLKNGAPAPAGSHRAVFVDDGTGFWWNYGVAEAMVDAGWRVTIVTPSAAVAHLIPVESVAALLGRLAMGKTEFRVLSGIESIEPGAVHVMPMVSGQSERLDCDLLVMQTGRVPVSGPAKALLDAGMREVHSIGDCITPRRMAQAVFEAQRIARVI
ncbi:FAD-dependent oxidoreductase [Duganella sp. LjRoot269]|jgi:2,4-dienoyl-CoA reductase (NADPH2)|uniref:oxidoreductase n=1 Tax=Duganella sp. LjRoot269 TaxID=3342305 RepID=UPI003ECEF72D